MNWKPLRSGKADQRLVFDLRLICKELSGEGHRMNRVIYCCLLFSLMYPISSSPAAHQKEKGVNKAGPVYEKKNDKERIYNIPFDTMWDKCVQIAKDSFNVTFISRDEGIVNFESGQKFTSNPFRYGVSLSKIDDERTKIVVNVQNKGWGGILSAGQRNRRTKEFFSSLDERLVK